MEQNQATNATPGLTALAIGVDPFSMKILIEALPAVAFRQVEMDVTKLLDEQGQRAPEMIFCGKLPEGMSFTELATAVRTVFPDNPLFYISSERKGFDQAAFIKNGFSDAFLLPMDRAVVAGLVPEASDQYRNVPLIEISPDTTLEFDTYVLLPLNRKYIRFSAKGHALARPRAQRLFEHEVRKVYVPQDQLPAYIKFTSDQLRKINEDTKATPAEKRAMMQRAVRSLLTGFISDNAEIKDSAAVVREYIVGTSTESAPVLERIANASGSAGDAYSHVSNVSTLASLFSLGLGIGKVEEIALASLLHDIGLADIPADLQEKPPEERSEQEQLRYQEHPALALQIIKKRQIELSTRVTKIIEQHHERWDAKGYPAELRGEAIMPESQLVAMADELEYLTQVRPGKERISAKQALERILKSEAYDPALRAKMAELLGFAPETPEQNGKTE